MSICKRSIAALLLLLGACNKAPTTSSAPSASTAASAPSAFAAGGAAADADVAEALRQTASAATTYVDLPGASGPAFLDYIAYEKSPSRVWVPVPETASVDVFDIATLTFHRIDGFANAKKEWHSKMRTFGPSAVTIGDGFAYVGNRATSEVCPIDVKTLKASACFKTPNALDGIAYVASAKEVWVTSPEDQSLTVLDASKGDSLKAKTIVKVGGAPEGFAVDDLHGLFFTNLEDKGGTVVIDVKSHSVKSTWNAACGNDGPRGVAVDPARALVIVACTEHVQVLDAAHNGTLLGKLETGLGVDNIDLIEPQHLLFVAAAKAARLTVAKVDAKGQLTVVATIPTTEGARNAVADSNGNAYVADSQGAHLIVAANGLDAHGR